MIFGYFNNVMPANVRYARRDADITNLYEAMEKTYVMEENMFESNVDP